MMRLKKRVLSLILSIIIFSLSIFIPYYEVKAVDLPTAFWGTLEYSRAFATAMSAGGALDRGIDIDDFLVAPAADWQNLQRLTLHAYGIFCVAKEKLRIKSENPSLSDDEVNSQAETSGQKMKTDFEDRALKVNNTTNGLTIKDFKYWQEFCKSMSFVAKNGLGGGDIGDNTVIKGKIINYSGINITSSLQDNLGKNTISYDKKNYITKGLVSNVEVDVNDNVPTDRVRICYILMYSNSSDYVYRDTIILDINRLSGQVIATSFTSPNGFMGYLSNYSEIINDVVSTSSLPIIISPDEDQYNNIVNNYATYLSVGNAVGNDYEEAINDALKGSGKVGTSIEKGNAKQKTTEIVRADSVPIKRSSLKEEEKDGAKVVSGVVGWDIPNTAIIESAIAYPQTEDDYVKGIGVVDVPIGDIIDGTTDSGDIAIPIDTPVVIPDTEEEDVPEDIPITDVISGQYGEFYPDALGIEDFFPFCIPFDLINLVKQFDIQGEHAPVITIPIMYPDIMAQQLGTDRYDVVIDFSDFLVLRNILRIFLLIGFIIGLLKLTRDIIRG